MRKKIGEYLVSRGILTPAQVEQILNYARIKGLRFGEAGLEMGLLSKEALIRAFGPNYMVDFFHLVPEYFPEVTKDLFDQEFLMRWGVLPLGYKTVWKFFRTKKLVNVGLVDPSRKDAIHAVRERLREKLGESAWAGTKEYLILADEFVSVLEKVYRVPAEQLRRYDNTDPTVRLFLET